MYSPQKKNTCATWVQAPENSIWMCSRRQELPHQRKKTDTVALTTNATHLLDPVSVPFSQHLHIAPVYYYCNYVELQFRQRQAKSGSDETKSCQTKWSHWKFLPWFVFRSEELCWIITLTEAADALVARCKWTFNKLFSKDGILIWLCILKWKWLHLVGFNSLMSQRPY